MALGRLEDEVMGEVPRDNPLGRWLMDAMVVLLELLGKDGAVGEVPINYPLWQIVGVCHGSTP